jgi:hypothetical protein
MLRRVLAFVLVLVLCGCGDVSVLGTLPTAPPTITAFTANPAAFDAAGGTTMLSWTVVNEDNLSLEPGAGDVTGFTAASLSLGVTTTYTLSAGNSLGQSASTLTVTVGP